MRPLPLLTPENTPFWTGGERGELMIVHCDACDAAIHPPQAICPRCLGRETTPRAAAGTGTIHSYTVNHQAWAPGMAVPFGLALVDLDAEEGVRLTAEMICDDPEAVRIGDRVAVTFLPVADVWIPQVRPA